MDINGIMQSLGISDFYSVESFLKIFIFLLLFESLTALLGSIFRGVK